MYVCVRACVLQSMASLSDRMRMRGGRVGTTCLWLGRCVWSVVVGVRSAARARVFVCVRDIIGVVHCMVSRRICLRLQGDDYAPCKQFMKAYMSLCPIAWVCALPSSPTPPANPFLHSPPPPVVLPGLLRVDVVLPTPGLGLAVSTLCILGGSDV